ncbi:hypothetical protein [Teichococcus aestuarii]|uniref:hypothetical protein n=1 Tax=Teichococcus aestuarii TaxID=568898 RepID=UPI0036188583
MLGGTLLSALLNRVALADLEQSSGATTRRLFFRAALAAAATSLIIALSEHVLLRADATAEFLWLLGGFMPLSATAHAMTAYLIGLRQTVPMRRPWSARRRGSPPSRQG